LNAAKAALSLDIIISANNAAHKMIYIFAESEQHPLGRNKIEREKMKKSPDNAKRDSLSLQQQQLSVVLLTKLIYQFSTRTDEHESFLCAAWI